jgi:hypothetical protein
VRDGAALRRAQLGAALRRWPSELRPARSPIDATVGEVARELEHAAPGVALMIQLRARFFDEAVRATWRRGIRQLVTIGVGFDDRRLRTFARRGGLALHVDEHDVIVATAACGGVQRLPVATLDRGLTAAISWLEEIRACGASLFVVQNVSLWTTMGALTELLPTFRAAAPGSELLMNVVDGERSPFSPTGPAAFGLAVPGSAAEGSEAIFTTLVGQANELGLQVRARIDSVALQRRYVGLDDLLIRERYLWFKTPRAGDHRGRNAVVLAMLGATSGRHRSPVFRPTDRPLLRPDVVLETSARATMITRAITRLRTLKMCATQVEIAAARLLDGRRTIDDITEAIATAERRIADVDVLHGVERLHVAGLLADDESGESGAGTIADRITSLRALARAALSVVCRRPVGGADRLVGTRRVLDALGSFQANPVLRHLRTLVIQQRRGMLRARLIADGQMHVLLRDDEPSAWGREVLADATAGLSRISAMLGVVPNPRVLIDLTPSRLGIPLTWVEAAEPCTLIRIPRPSYSRQILVHELTHVVATGCSPWLAEGLAVWLQRRIAPGDCHPGDVNYRRAAMFVEFVIDAFGLAKFLDVFTTPDRISLEKLEDAWHASLRRRHDAVSAELSEGM